jgi:Kef-type K+ transport system membrane component KefB
VPPAVLALVDLLLVLAVALLLRRVLARVRQPPVMAEVLAGLVLGASVLGVLPGDPAGALFTPEAREILTVLGQIALVGYVFTVGGELDMGALRRERRAVALVAAGSYLAPFAAGALLALAIHDEVAGDPPLAAFVLFLGTALAVTAFPVLARIVDARGLAGLRAGRVALTSAAAQELVIWPSLAVALALAGAGERSVAGTAALDVLALVAVLGLARLVVPALARRAPRLAGPAALAALGLSAVATEVTGLHLVLGAFLFGAALPQAPRSAALALLRSRPAAVSSAALLPLFFALPALRVDVWILGADGLGLLAAVLAVAAAAKLLSAAGSARLAGLARRDAWTVGALMNARGLVELVVLTVGLDAGLVDERLFAVMVLMALATTFATGPLVERIGRAREPEAGAAGRRAMQPG